MLLNIINRRPPTKTSGSKHDQNDKFIFTIGGCGKQLSSWNSLSTHEILTKHENRRKREEMRCTRDGCAMELGETKGAFGGAKGVA